MNQPQQQFKLEWSKEKLGRIRFLPVFTQFGMSAPYFQTRVHSPYFPGAKTKKQVCPKVHGEHNHCEICDVANAIKEVAFEVRNSPQGAITSKGFFELLRNFEAKNSLIVPIVQRSSNVLVWREFSEYAMKTLQEDLIAQFGSVQAGWDTILDPHTGFDVIVSKPDKAYVLRADLSASCPIIPPGDRTLNQACTNFMNSLSVEACYTLHRNVQDAAVRRKELKTWYDIAGLDSLCGIPFPSGAEPTQMQMGQRGFAPIAKPTEQAQSHPFGAAKPTGHTNVAATAASSTFSRTAPKSSTMVMDPNEDDIPF